jgi:hypothetical protein
MLQLGIANFLALQMIKNHPDNHELNSRYSKKVNTLDKFLR